MIPIIFINGKYIPNNMPCIEASDRGFLLGEGIFETIKSVQGKISFFDAHYRRLKTSAQLLGIACPWTQTSLEDICHQLLEKNYLNQGLAFIRITLTGGIAERGLIPLEKNKSTLVVQVGALKSRIDEPIRLTISNVVRNEQSPWISLKTLQYLDNIFARKYADIHGFDDALMLNTAGNITETSVANIFFIQDLKLITPKIGDGILNGIIRQKILEIVRAQGIIVEERSIAPAEITTFDSAFITNSLIEMQRVHSIKDICFPKEQNLMNKIQDCYLAEQADG